MPVRDDQRGGDRPADERVVHRGDARTRSVPAPARNAMRIRLEARPEPSRARGWLSPLVAAAATLVIGFVLFTALGQGSVRRRCCVFFVEPVATRYGVGELLLKASPLMLCAVGLAVGYRANVWNIGAEGQLTMGAIGGGGVALAFSDVELAAGCCPRCWSRARSAAWRGRRSPRCCARASTPTRSSSR